MYTYSLKDARTQYNGSSSLPPLFFSLYIHTYITNGNRPTRHFASDALRSLELCAWVHYLTRLVLLHVYTRIHHNITIYRHIQTFLWEFVNMMHVFVQSEYVYRYLCIYLGMCVYIYIYIYVYSNRLLKIYFQIQY